MTPDSDERELRYSPSFGGYFWQISIPNPAPIKMPDGTDNILDLAIRDSGFRKRRKTAERAMRKAERRIRRNIARCSER